MKIVYESLNEFQNINKDLNPLDSLNIGMQFKKHLIDRMKESYRRGYSSQNKKDWGFSSQLWHATIKKILSSSTKIDITDYEIIISSSLLKNDNLNLIVNCLNFIQDNWNIRSSSYNTNDKSIFTFVSK